MKKLLFAILILLPFAVDASAANYFGCASANITANSTFCATPSGSCAGSDPVTAATALQAGNNLYANGCTIVVNDSFTAGLIATTDGDAGGAAVAGGGFTLDLATVTGKTLTTAITAGSTDCLAISGAAGAGTVLTIVGAITGSSTTASKYGVNDSHTGTTSVVVVTGAVSGGSSGAATGYLQSGTTTGGIHTFTGNATAAGGAGIVLNTSTAGSTITGDVIGSDTATYNGVSMVGSGGITITGSITNGLRGSGANGATAWTPAADDYIFFKFGTDIYASIAPSKAKVLSDTSVVISTTGAYEAGTATSGGGGGGAWGF